MGLLYDRWQAVAKARADDVALVQTDCGQTWTFAKLWQLGKSTEPPQEPVLTVRGRDVDLVLGVLRAWKYEVPLLPLDGESPAHLPPVAWLQDREIAHFKQTSGSTGQPRLIGFTAAQLAADAASIVPTMGLRKEWPNVGVISLAHSYGFSNLVLPLLLHGIPLRLAADPLPTSVTRALAGMESVTLPAVPALWKAWRDTKILTPSIQLAISAGAPLSLELETSIHQQCGLKVHNFYGSSECGGIGYDRTEHPRQQEHLAGTPLQGVTLSVNASGRLEVTSAAVGTGYWPKDHEDLAAGKFITTDLVRLGQHEEIYLEGRATEVINVAGRKVNPAEIEAHLQRHPAVKYCLVFGQPSRDTSRCEEIVALVALHDGASLTELKSTLPDLPSWQFPRHWHHVPDLAPDHRGKLSRAVWKSKFASPRLS